MNLITISNTVNEIFYNSSSYNTIASIQKEMLAILGANTKIQTITDKQVNKYFKELISRGNEPATVNNKMMYLSKILNYAHRTQQIQYKPYIPTMKLTAQKDIFIKPEEYQMMLDYAKQKDLIELYLIIVIGYNTGIRISNILSILPEDIQNNYIRIFRNKTNQPYSVPMNQAVQEALKDFKGFSMNYRQAQYRFSTMIQELELDSRITIHTLRHTTCSKLVREGVPLPVVQALMNHKRITTTMRYNHLRNEQLESAVSML